jgi:predicted ATP-dependent serine protease
MTADAELFPHRENQGEGPCPHCASWSIYLRDEDRYLHVDGTPNRECWAAISRGDKPAQPVLADQILSISALNDLPDPEPLIDNVLDKGTVALLYGKWGSLKSFTALDWGASVATGRPWQGRPVEQGNVLYIAAEGAFGIKGRVNAWEQGWQRQILDGALDILPRSVNLLNQSDMRNLGALIKWAGYRLVVIDTLSRCMVGADENSAKDCGIAVDVLHQLRECTPDGRGVILGLHHAGKDGKTFRGSSAFEAGADTVYSTTRDGAVIGSGPREAKRRSTA